MGAKRMEAKRMGAKLLRARICAAHGGDVFKRHALHEDLKRSHEERYVTAV